MHTLVLEKDSLQMRQLIQSARSFALNELHTQNPVFDRNHFLKMGKLGFTALASEEARSDFGSLGIAALLFEFARAQLGPAIYLSVHLMVSRLIREWSKDDRYQNLLQDLYLGKKLGAFCLTEAQAGSDAAALRTKAEKKGTSYEITGEKLYITSGGLADVYLVFARTGEDGPKGISAFVVEKDAPGLSFGKPEKKMGCEGSPITSVAFDRCRITEHSLLGTLGDGYRIALSGLAGGRLNIAAASCAVASRALEISINHVKTRKQFGQPLSSFQGLQFMLAEMAMKLKASLLLTRAAAEELDGGEWAAGGASIAKCFASDRAMEITTDAVQILGAAGYIADFEVERLMRDAKMLQIVEGTNQIQRILIARALLGPEAERN